MCILTAACKKNKDRGVTLMEIIVVMVIVAVLATVAGTGWTLRIEQVAAENAMGFLNLSWQAEQNYFAWKNSYTQDWNALDIDNPNKTDKFYVYTIDKATAQQLIINAARRNKSSGFAINELGVIKGF
jgi:prepilin-type N-terminal cleavage/methylation domain-containing protein